MSATKREAAVQSAEQRIGPELKRLREHAALSVRTLAERAGFSASFISQIENSQVSPSIASLETIAATLGVTLADFFAPNAEETIAVVRADERPSFRSSWSRARIEAIAPLAASRSLEAIMVTLEASGSSGKQPAGVANEQVAIVFAGSVSLTMAGDTVELNRGDAVFIPAGTPHRWHNSHKGPAQILVTSSRARR